MIYVIEAYCCLRFFVHVTQEKPHVQSAHVHQQKFEHVESQWHFGHEMILVQNMKFLTWQHCTGRRLLKAASKTISTDALLICSTVDPYHVESMISFTSTRRSDLKIRTCQWNGHFATRADPKNTLSADFPRLWLWPTLNRLTGPDGSDLTNRKCSTTPDKMNFAKAERRPHGWSCSLDRPILFQHPSKHP